MANFVVPEKLNLTVVNIRVNKNSPPPPKRTCANPEEDVTKSNIFKTIPASCCDGQKPVNNICPNTPPSPPGNSGVIKWG